MRKKKLMSNDKKRYSSPYIQVLNCGLKMIFTSGELFDNDGIDQDWDIAFSGN